MPASKAAAVVATTPTIPIGRLPDQLLVGLQSHLTDVLGGDPRHDLEQVDMQGDADGSAYCGYWKKHLRMVATLTVDTTDQTGEVILVATRGSLEADVSLFGQQGKDIGNAVLVARLFHIAIFYLRAAGLRAMTNSPYTPRLRRKYARMGFDNGERLPLDDVARLTQAFAYIEDVYQKYGLSLALPPLPL